MLGFRLLYLASLATYTFGALTFSVLAFYYWRARRLKLPSTGGRVFPIFTAVCAAAFLINLLLQAAGAAGVSNRWTASCASALPLVISVLPALLANLVVEQASARRLWYVPLALLYVAGLASNWAEQFEKAPAWLLLAAAVVGLAVPDSRTVRPHRLWLRVLLCLLALCALANLIYPSPLVSLLPDYLVLAFFCVTLYYRERLVFFDLLIKRGAFFAVGLVVLTLFFAFAPAWVEQLPEDWTRPWIAALFLLPFWLLGPWTYSHLERRIDRSWLRRPFTPAEAERQFVHDVYGALTIDELTTRAEASLSAIFQAPAKVHPDGAIDLSPRPGPLPYLSDDQRLLESLTRTLAIVVENLRLREQRKELRYLADRAELKALRAQINPHFLFNALNAIAGLIQDRPQLADETVEQLAQVFRYTLSKSENEWVSLDEEIEFVTAYLRVEQARFADRLHVEIDVEPAARTRQIPAMTIQPLVENAIRHGVAEVEGRGEVKVTAAVDGTTLTIEVADNGPGFPEGFTLGHGLRNIADRLKGYYGDSARLSWECNGGWTRVRLTMELPA